MYQYTTSPRRFSKEEFLPFLEALGIGLNGVHEFYSKMVEKNIDLVKNLDENLETLDTLQEREPEVAQEVTASVFEGIEDYHELREKKCIPLFELINFNFNLLVSEKEDAGIVRFISSINMKLDELYGVKLLPEDLYKSVLEKIEKFKKENI